MTAVAHVQVALLHGNQSGKKTQSLYPFHDSSYRKDSLHTSEEGQMAVESHVRVVLRVFVGGGCWGSRPWHLPPGCFGKSAQLDTRRPVTVNILCGLNQVAESLCRASFASFGK